MEENKLIYVVTAIEPDTYSSRAFGYFFSLGEAMESVTNNEGDLHECLYTHAVIEAFPAGLWRMPISEFWYRWDFNIQSWAACDKPIFANGVVNWGIG